eukprot:210080-Chlamydomonas_euryale.AAC.1
MHRIPSNVDSGPQRIYCMALHDDVLAMTATSFRGIVCVPTDTKFLGLGFLGRNQPSTLSISSTYAALSVPALSAPAPSAEYPSTLSTK